jgi:hypothetical protein
LRNIVALLHSVAMLYNNVICSQAAFCWERNR